MGFDLNTLIRFDESSHHLQDLKGVWLDFTSVKALIDKHIEVERATLRAKRAALSRSVNTDTETKKLDNETKKLNNLENWMNSTVFAPGLLVYRKRSVEEA